MASSVLAIAWDSCVILDAIQKKRKETHSAKRIGRRPRAMERYCRGASFDTDTFVQPISNVPR